jgi:hypothetical protein
MGRGSQALDLGEAHGLKSPEIGPRPLQVYQRSCGRLPKPSKLRVVIFSGSDWTGDGVCDWDLTGLTMVSVSRDCGDEASGLGSDFSASPSVNAGTPVISAVDSVVRGNFFSFPLVIFVVAPTFSGPAIVSLGSKSALRKDAIQLYRISRRELEKRLS